MPTSGFQPTSGSQKSQAGQGQETAQLPPEVESQIPQGQARLSQATGQSLSQMEPHRVLPHLMTLLAELAAGLQVLQQVLQSLQQPPQPPQGA